MPETWPSDLGPVICVVGARPNFMKMAKYLNPKNDLAFKRIFGEHKHLCISLLNSMLPLAQDQQVVSIEYQSGELERFPVTWNRIQHHE